MIKTGIHKLGPTKSGTAFCNILKGYNFIDNNMGSTFQKRR